MRIAVAVAVACLSVAALAAGSDAQAVMRQYELNIPKQSLDAALREFAQQTGLQIALFSDAIDGNALVGPILGKQTAESALKTLLEPRGLKFKVVGQGTIAVVNSSEPEVGKSSSSRNSQDNAAGSGVQLASATGTAGGVQKDGGASQSASETEHGEKLEEVVVTAQKRVERLQDVPVPVTAVSAEALVNSNQSRIQDYFTRIPGLSVTPENFDGTPRLTIRGITTGGFTNPTVGVLVDDVQYGSSTNSGGGGTAPDIDPSDLARVEVLRGPQGTLYGASSMGGLLKFVTADPSTVGFSGRVQAGTTSVAHGDDIGYNLRGAVNVPLGQTLALRASGFTRRDPGYIDDPVHGIHDVNETNADGGRLSALWKPSDSFSVKLGALYQDIKTDGSSYVRVAPGLGDLQQSFLPGTGWLSRKAGIYDMTLRTKMGSVDLTAISGYNSNKASVSIDFTPLIPSGFFFLQDVQTDKFSQEVRLSAPIGERFEWLLGGFYTNEDSELDVDAYLANLATGAPTLITQDAVSGKKFKESAGFFNLTYHVTSRFDLQIGGRQSENKQSTFTTQKLTNTTSPTVSTKGDAFTYLVTPQFKVSPSLLLYGRFASGYRAGGPNLNVASCLTCAQKVDPDKTKNYEFGIKGDILNRAVTFDASLYYIDWQDIQIQIFVPSSTVAYYTNGSGAKSQGVELSVDTRPFKGITIGGWIALSDAELTDPLPPGPSRGARGDRLPYSGRFSGSLSLDQEFPFAGSAMAFVGATVSYVGDRRGVFTANGVRQTFPGYTQMDLRTGMRYGDWTLNAFATNLADKRGMLSGGLGTILPTTFSFIQPRTIGLSLTRTF